MLEQIKDFHVHVWLVARFLNASCYLGIGNVYKHAETVCTTQADRLLINDALLMYLFCFVF